MRAVIPWLLVLALLPRVEDPWPDTIGMELPILTGTAGAVLAGAGFFFAAPEKRDRAVKVGGFLGFCGGGALYCLALVIQLTSAL